MKSYCAANDPIALIDRLAHLIRDRPIFNLPGQYLVACQEAGSRIGDGVVAVDTAAMIWRRPNAIAGFGGTVICLLAGAMVRAIELGFGHLIGRRPPRSRTRRPLSSISRGRGFGRSFGRGAIGGRGRFPVH